MILLVGLGNPGPRYKHNRHNIGWMAADAIAAEHIFGNERKRFHGLASEGYLSGKHTVILKPTTYMNCSGQAVAAAVKYYKIISKDILVIQDEMDLIPGKIRLKRGGGAAGHRGLLSIDAHIGNDYRRLRLGIGHPNPKKHVNDYVLGNFNKSDFEWLDKLLNAVATAAPMLADSNDIGFQTTVATMAPPPAL